jgi:hypothetical protein
MDHRIERVALETDRYRISGDLTLPKEGYRSRVSDYLNIAELAFIPRANAEITPLAGGEPERREFIAVGRVHVQLAYPTGEQGEPAQSD